MDQGNMSTSVLDMPCFHYIGILPLMDIIGLICFQSAKPESGMCTVRTHLKVTRIFTCFPNHHTLFPKQVCFMRENKKKLMGSLQSVHFLSTKGKRSEIIFQNFAWARYLLKSLPQRFPLLSQANLPFSHFLFVYLVFLLFYIYLDVLI